MKWIVLWGLCAVTAAALAGVFAGSKNRDVSFWMAWCFLFPPLIVWLMLMPKNRGLPPKPRPLDDFDSQRGGEIL